MNNNRIGCLSPLAILSALITLVVIIAAELLSGNTLFTAGALNAQPGRTMGGISSHAEMGGDCGLCHAAPWDADKMSDRCMACHENIREEQQDPESIHGAIAASNSDSECRDCHPEHNGPNASLIADEIKGYPHEKSGFLLTAHRRTTDGIPFHCRDCHAERFSNFDQDTCTQCHQAIDRGFMDAHRQDFGDNCQVCHDGADRFSGFNHSQTNFTLDGEHFKIACSGCHINARKPADLGILPVACEACHRPENPHREKFPSCGECHTSAGWSPAEFDHDLASFKLVGEHAEAECKDCHRNGIREQVASDCYSCHKQDDEHNGEYGQDCAACHDPASDWEDAIIDHNLFSFKLDGAHTQVECTQCHLGGVFKGIPTDCYSCHTQDDQHNGRFGTICSLCHSTSDWGRIIFSHYQSRFPLTGRHADLSCESCHAGGRFANTPLTCAGCHGEPAYHAGMFSSNCASCHNTNNWSASYTGPHPQISDDDGGSGVNHGGQGCDSCHTKTLREASCSNCHDGNDFDDDGEDDD